MVTPDDLFGSYGYGSNYASNSTFEAPANCAGLITDYGAAAVCVSSTNGGLCLGECVIAVRIFLLYFEIILFKFVIDLTLLWLVRVPQ
jgi:hypothetical protein